MSLGRAKGAAPGAAHALVAEAALDAFLALAASERPCDVPQPWGEKALRVGVWGGPGAGGLCGPGVPQIPELLYIGKHIHKCQIVLKGQTHF